MTRSNDDQDMGEPLSDADVDVQSVPLEGDDGETVIISQQNAGPGSMVGQGEFPDPASEPKDPSTAAAEQAALQEDRPI